MLKKIFLTALLLAMFVTCGCSAQAGVGQNVKGNLKIAMFNIGHGDAILIQTGKQTILIDTAQPKMHAALVSELEKFSVTKIDKLILTHPHGDHIGGAKMLISPSQKELTEYPYLKKISVAEVYDNGVAYGSAGYKGYLRATKAKKIPYQNLKAGDTLYFGNGVNFKVLWPTEEFVSAVNSTKFPKEDRQHNTNNGSIVGKLTYKDFSMLFTGDCEKESEAKLVANNAADLKCDVLKSCHHGSVTSSTKKFLKAVHPSYVLISAANTVKDDGDAYGLPRRRVTENYLWAGIGKKNILCTRFNGTITITSDGKNFSVEPEIKEVWVDKWIAHLKDRQQQKKLQQQQ